MVALTAAAPATSDLAAMRACVEANAPRSSTVLQVALAVDDGAGETTETRFKLYWRRLPSGERRVLIRFSAPQDLARAAVLIEGVREARPRVHLFLPDLGKPQRITSREQLEGFLGRADLGVDEIGLLLDPAGGDDTRLIEAHRELDGRAYWVIETRSDQEDGERYARTLTFVDRELCIPLRAELYETEAGKPKLVSVDPARVTREARSWIPREMVFRDPRSGSVATLRVEAAEVDVPLAPSLLTVGALAGMSGG